MMLWLQATDTALFRFVNQSLANPVFDWLMPRLAGHVLFFPLVLLTALLLLWRGGRRGRIFVLALALAITLADGFLCNSIRNSIRRPRPGLTVTDTRALLRSSTRGSFPSAHATNWAAAAMVGFLFYRRSWRLLVPAAATVAFSRVYCGVHYPADVLVGAILGAGSGFATVWLINVLWCWVGRKWFPLWWARLPLLANPDSPADPEFAATSAATTDQHWLRLGYLLIAALLLFRLFYIASGTISLSEDEAYQWLWSKHLALSYYSKPPGIALIQFAGTSLWGDTELGVRFFSPVFATILSVVLLRFMAREVGARQGFLLLLVISATPLLAVGGILMTVDPPLVLCWTLAMFAGWRAVQADGMTKHWLLAALALGLGFLCKYTATYQILCWAIFFVLWKPARLHLRKPGPYLALLVVALCTLPVVVWNTQHGWISATHVATNASLDKAWRPTLRYFGEFLGAEFGLLNPVFFGAALWAMVAFWRRRTERPLWLFFFCMGAPVFLGHVIYSLRSRIHPNWIAPAVLPMLCLMVAYWDARWREGCRTVARWFVAGITLGLLVVVLMHESRLIGKLAGQSLPGEMDPLRRVRAWKETAALVEAARKKLESEGRPAFIIGDHYGITGLLSFYLPAAKKAPPPLVYPESSSKPKNQLFFWPEYRYGANRQGQNAIFVQQSDHPKFESGWAWKWLGGQPVGYAALPAAEPAPPRLIAEFETVTDLGVFEVKLGNRVFRRVQLFECRGAR